MEIREMSIDLETYSDIDITKCGAYKYAESDHFEILLFGVSVNGEPVKVYDLACGDTIPEEILAALSDENVIKWAFNASFERICLSKIKIIPLLHSQNPLYDILPYKLHSHQSKRHPSYKPECHKSISIFYYQITLNIFCFKGLSSLSEIPISFLAFSNPCIVVVKHFCNTCG